MTKTRVREIQQKVREWMLARPNIRSFSLAYGKSNEEKQNQIALEMGISKAELDAFFEDRVHLLCVEVFMQGQ